MKLNILSLLSFIFFILSCSGKGDTNGNGEDVIDKGPEPISFYPQEGATNVPAGTITIKLTFDQNISFSSTNLSSITLSDASVLKANVIESEGKYRNLTIYASGLIHSKLYRLIIPKGIIKGANGIYNDNISLSFTTVDAPAITSTLCDKNSVIKTQQLFKYMVSIYGSKSFSSTMASVNWNNKEAEYVNKITGKYPAINCYDFIHIAWSPANWINYSDLTPIKDWADKGGIISLMWHFNVPASGNTLTDLNSYTCTPEKTTFRAANIFVEGSWENKFFYSQMDKVCDVLSKMQEAGYVALWRPFHEGAGNIYTYTNGKAWFWWGADGGEIYVKIWKAMFDYFQLKGIHNLIWIWTTQNSGDEAFYPGDNYVDIVGRDIYGFGIDKNIYEYNTISLKYSNKMVALSECGNYIENGKVTSEMASISSQWNRGSRWLYFMPWYDYDFNEGKSSTNIMCYDSFWKDAMQQDFVLTREDVKGKF